MLLLGLTPKKGVEWQIPGAQLPGVADASSQEPPFSVGLLCPSHQTLTSPVPTASLGDAHCYPHHIDEKTEAQGKQLHSNLVAGPGFKYGSLPDSKSHSFHCNMVPSPRGLPVA